MTEKIWSTDPNFAVATTSSALVMGQSVMLQLKNKMVSEAGWTVVGSSDGTIFEWEGEEAFPLLTDVGSSANTGTMTNMVLGDLAADSPGGPFTRRSLLLNGTDEYVTMGDVLGFTRTTPLSISAWIKTSATGSAQTILSKMEGSTTYTGWAFIIDGSAQLWLYLISDWATDNAVAVNTNPTGLFDGNWHHVAACYTGSSAASGVTLYIDGVAQATSTLKNGLTGSMATAAHCNIGRRQDNGPAIQYWDGNLTEIAVHGAGLTPAEVAAIYNEGEPTDLAALSSSSSLVDWWRPDLTGTAGGVYGGESTGSYDVWEAPADVVRAADGSGPGWCILKSPTSPSGTFYATLAMEGLIDSDSNGYFAFSDSPWLRSLVDPLLWLPDPTAGAAQHGVDRKSFFLMFGGTYTTRGYFSGAPDGSFVYTQNLTDRAYFTGLIMFHVLDPYSAGDNPMPTCSYVHSADGGWTYGVYADQFHGYHRRPELESESVSFRSCYPVYDGGTRVFATMSTTDFESKVEGFPTYLIAGDDAIALVAGRQAVLGRIPDMFAAPEGLSDGDNMPVATPAWFVFGDWILPGGPPPTLGP